MTDIIECNGRKFSVFLHKDEIDELTSHLADQINARYKDSDNLLVIGVLNGAFVFLSDLIRKIDIELEMDFVKLRSYDETQSTGYVTMDLSLKTDIRDRDILVVEDIIDTGLTMEFFLDLLKSQFAKSVAICSLLSKPDIHNNIIDIDFVGKEISSEFVIGYGLDYSGKARNLPHIYSLIVE